MKELLRPTSLHSDVTPSSLNRVGLYICLPCQATDCGEDSLIGDRMFPPRLVTGDDDSFLDW